MKNKTRQNVEDIDENRTYLQCTAITIIQARVCAKNSRVRIILTLIRNNIVQALVQQTHILRRNVLPVDMY